MKFTFNLEDIKYIKILYLDNNNNPHTVKGAVKSINDREIVSCIKFQEDIDVKKEQNVTLSIVCNEGLYRTDTKLKSVDIEEPYIFFILETPQGMEFQQNREYFRVASEYNCAYYIYNEEKTTCITGKTVDISANGISIIVPVHAVSEENSEIEIMIDERIVRSYVKCVRSEEVENGYKLSFMFEQISNSDRDFISQVCIKKQLEQKRNSLS